MTTFEPVLAHRTAKGAQRVQELIAVAGEQVLAHGDDGVAVDAMITQVGGSCRNVYGHVGGKEGLFKTTVLHVAAEMAKPFDQLKIDGQDVVEVLSVFGRELVRTALSAQAPPVTAWCSPEAWARTGSSTIRRRNSAHSCRGLIEQGVKAVIDSIVPIEASGTACERLISGRARGARSWYLCADAWLRR